LAHLPIDSHLPIVLGKILGAADLILLSSFSELNYTIREHGCSNIFGFLKDQPSLLF
jgi:hypothetical protein